MYIGMQPDSSGFASTPKKILDAFFVNLDGLDNVVVDGHPT